MKNNPVNYPDFLHKAFKISALFVIAAGLVLSGCKSKPKFVMPSEEVKSQVESDLNTFAMTLAGMQVTTDTLLVMIRDYLVQHPKIYGSTFAFAPVILNGDTLKSAPYLHRKGDDFIIKNLVGSYDYTQDQWFCLPVEKKQPVWSDPYFDTGGGEAWMITYSIPVYTPEGTLTGVVTSDVELETKK